MLEDILAYTDHEGGEWKPWPFPRDVKPSSLELSLHRGPYFHFHHNKYVTVFKWRRFRLLYLRHYYLRLHSIKLTNGGEWDCLNGARMPLL